MMDEKNLTQVVIDKSSSFKFNSFVLLIWLPQDGFEMVFTANHLSHFLLTTLLLPELEITAGRIVNLSSSLYRMTKKFDFDNVMSEKAYSLFATYSQSKLANILFTVELQKRYYYYCLHFQG